MIKPQTKQTITIKEILETIKTNDLPAARQILSSRIGAGLCFEGKIEKVVNRDGLKLCIKPCNTSDGEQMDIFADFTNEASREQVLQKKIRKGSQVSITGKFQTFGLKAVNLTDCFIK